MYPLVESMNRVYVVSVASVLIGMHLAHNAFLSQWGLPIDSTSNAWLNRHYCYVGVLFSQPAILAAWTWFG
ncbi:MAG: hypothetical protein KDB23_13130 [Planctomycetales bacterium]|nr:hypothetical protein [Planctomycetales bacterium]